IVNAAFLNEAQCEEIVEKIQSREWRGAMRCRISPPKDDFVGVIPKKCDERLMFSLEEQVGCWTHHDLYTALERGYSVTRVYEIHSFPLESMTNKLFRGYVEFFLRVKIEAEGWPRENMTDEEKEAYCEEWYVNNGNMAKPRINHIRKNPGLRHVAK